MKSILDLTKAIEDKEYNNAQFDESGIQKNVLFISPQLSGKHFYKFLLPYFCMLDETVVTAITTLEKYNPDEYLKTMATASLAPKQVIWADYIVFPFTLRELSSSVNGVSIYESIKTLNPHALIVYHLDFNFYELSEMHPYYKVFDSAMISTVEDNIFNADICMVSNLIFQKYLIEKLNKLSTTKYKGITPNLSVTCMPLMADVEIMTANMEYIPDLPVNIDNREKVKNTAKKAEDLKKEDLKTKKTTTNGSGKGGKKRGTTKKLAGTNGTEKKGNSKGTGKKRGRPKKQKA